MSDILADTGLPGEVLEVIRDLVTRAGYDLDDEGEAAMESVGSAVCSDCHLSAVASFSKSVHAALVVPPSLLSSLIPLPI